jgi:cell wall-associated NlpC family hydrolase
MGTPNQKRLDRLHRRKSHRPSKPVRHGGIEHPRNKYPPPINGPGGFDCSGLTHAAYAAAGIQIPRTAQTQYNAGPLLPGGTTAQAGDLIFFGTPDHVHHVAIATGNGSQIIHAPDVGQTVRLDDWRNFNDVFASSRPAAGLQRR